MAKQKTLIKTFAGINYDPDAFDIRPVDSPLLNDCYSEPRGGLSSPRGTTKYANVAAGGQVLGLYQYRSRKANYVIQSISDGSITSM